MKNVYILLGSNRGDREGTQANARSMITEMAGEIVKASPVYETAPWGFDDAVPFLNQVVEIDTELTPEALMDKLLTIEVRLGRIRPFDGCGCEVPAGGKGEPAVYAGRTIDLDILFYGDRLVFSESLMIPHPRLHERRFTLVPLSDVAPDFVHPLLKRPVSALLRECRDKSEVRPASASHQ